MKLKHLYAFVITVFIVFISVNIYAIEEPTIYSKYAIAVEADSLTLLYGKDIDKKVYPASITKIMTAILALENLSLEDNIIVSKTAIQVPWDSSTVYLKEGEIITVRELLYCLLLNSGNDAANVLAEAVSGSISAFVTLMNTKATELGCTGTNFVNAHGYSHDDHYTTALDIVKIFNYCIKNETFMNIISTKLYIVDETNKTDSKRYLYNTNRLILTKDESVHSRYYKYAIGGKTGYTDEAGRTLVSIGEKDGKKIIIAVFKAGTVDNKDARYTDAINLFEYTFNNYSKLKFANEDDFNFTYTNYNNHLKYSFKTTENLELLMKNDEDIVDISYELELKEILLNNINTKNFKPDTIIGNISFNINTNTSTYKANYDLTLTSVESFAIINDSNIFIWIIIFAVAGITFISIILSINSKKGNKHKSSRKHRQTKSYSQITLNKLKFK